MQINLLKAKIEGNTHHQRNKQSTDDTAKRMSENLGNPQ